MLCDNSETGVIVVIAKLMNFRNISTGAKCSAGSGKEENTYLRLGGEVRENARQRPPHGGGHGVAGGGPVDGESGDVLVDGQFEPVGNFHASIVRLTRPATSAGSRPVVT
ncbi:hypothetical protein GCM10011574_34370 [Microbispora bryophytorum]|uniref:Uncharacterized protein n=1 Tax=Microbispora bryophytorum TaxID=1460882 RepID=A0A8H9H4I3_9ACTN|nr:hypothetical protein GCM10011574_34370 [Microbispora bryophytorum]